MVSPISALNSRSPSVQALAKVAAVAPKASAEETSTPSGAAAAAPSPALGPGARDALPAGYRNLALPLGGSDSGAKLAAAQGPTSESPLIAAYGPSEASLAGLPRLVGNRLPVQTVVREAQAALRERDAAQGATPAEFLDSAPIVAGARLPSGNAPDAEATLRASLLARDGEKGAAALDIYLTKTGPSSFEAVAYDRDFAAPAGGFPYAAPPLSFDRILFDPAFQALVAVAAGQTPMKRPIETAGAKRLSLVELAAASAIAAATLLAVAMSLGADRPFAAAASAGVGLGGLAYALRSRLLR